MRPTTLCLLVKENEILLAMKKRGFGVGKWNGVGGKVDKEETIEEAAVREMKEEIGVTANLENLENVGNIKFYFKDNPEWDNHMHIFLIREWEREPRESEEMKPQWYKHQEIPYGEMWADDIHWMPLVLAGKKIEAEFHFNDKYDSFHKFEVREI